MARGAREDECVKLYFLGLMEPGEGADLLDSCAYSCIGGQYLAAN